MDSNTAPEALAAELEQLARLVPVEYDRARDAAAHRLGIRVSTLDSAVEKRRKALGLSLEEKNSTGRSVKLPTLKPHATPVNGVALLNELDATIRRYVALPDECAKAISLWVAFTHTLDAFQTSPRLAIKSPEKRCGKTTLLRVVQRLVPKPLPASNASGAALFRMIESVCPTLLIDEADTFLDDADGVRNVLNSGHTRDAAYTLRTVGDDHEPRQFSTWCPVAIAKIGNLPPTLEDRSIVISMRRKLPGERVERLRTDRIGEFLPLAGKAARWALDNQGALVHADPVVPDGLNDRAADNWRPLFAIADTAGAEWSAIARQVALSLSGGEQLDTEGTRVRLLADIRDIYDETGQERLPSTEIIERLVARDDLPWTELRGGKPITTPMLANLLRQFGIRPKVYRSGTTTSRGYLRADFFDAWDRYLEAVTPQQPSHIKEVRDGGTVTSESNVTSTMCGKSLSLRDCFRVAGSSPADSDDPEERAATLGYGGKPYVRGAAPAAGNTAPDPWDIPPFLRRK